MQKIKYFVKLVLIGSLLALSLPSCASSAHKNKKNSVDSEASNQNLDQLVGGVCKRADTGVFAQSFNSSKILYTYKADTPFSPASNMKVITAYAALKYLGPDFRYHTRFLTEASNVSSGGVLAGNLYVKFDGDPTLQLQNLDAMVKQLTLLGIHTIQGSLVIDGSRYDSNGVSPGTMDGDRRYCYGAPVEAAILNKNCVSFRLLPTRVGEPAQVDLPYGMQLPIMSSVSTSASHNCHLSMEAGQNGDYHINGCVSVNAKPSSLTIPVPQGSQFSEAAMVALLQLHHITVLGDKHFAVNDPKTPLRVIVDVPSKTLAELVVPMMKHSDNMFANTLFKTVGAHYNQQPGTWQNSASAVKAILQANGIETTSMVIIDGSGLSQDNLVTARQFVDVLRAAYRDPKIRAAYFDALPVGGLNGSLKNRLGFHDTIGKVHAKTGSMKGVSALSGYLMAKDNDVIIFSILVNDDFHGSLFGYRSFEDKACRSLLYQYG